MRRKPDSWNIVLAGFWNRLIFTPDWVNEKLFPGVEELEAKVAFLPIMPVIYQDSDVAIEVSNNRIVLRPRNTENPQVLQRTAKLAKVILESLPETPIQAIGANFGFVEEKPASRLLELFNFGDAADIAGEGWDFGQKKIVRRMIRNEDTLNLTLAYEGSRMEIDCNFHHERVTHSQNLSAVDEERILRLKDLAVSLLATVYDLHLRGEDA